VNEAQRDALAVDNTRVGGVLTIDAKPDRSVAIAAEGDAAQRVLDLRRQLAGMDSSEIAARREIENLERGLAAEKAKGGEADRSRLEVLAAQLAGAREMLPLVMRLTEEAKATAAAERSAAAVESLEEQVRGLYAVTEAQTRQVEIEREILRLRKANVTESQIQAEIARFTAALSWRAAFDQMKAARERAQQEMTSTVDGLRGSLASAVADGMVAGAQRGGKGMEDVLTQVLTNIQRQAAMALANTAVNALFGLFGGGGGGGGLLPQIFGVASQVLPGFGGMLPSPGTGGNLAESMSGLGMWGSGGASGGCGPGG
jgi:hypothetical protein